VIAQEAAVNLKNLDFSPLSEFLVGTVCARATSAHLPGHFGCALDAEAVSRENEKLTGLCANEFVVRARHEAAAPTGACAP
jgi:hypothetical protein